MATIIKAPNAIPDGFSVFLAGSIEMDSAPKWQTRVENSLSDFDIIVLNPRRDDWDASWIQNINNPQFRLQVEWELAATEHANIIAMYISPETKSPISLLELGLFAHTGKMIVCCPEGFWRKGNVDIVCKIYKIPQTNSLSDLIYLLKQKIPSKHKTANKCEFCGHPKFGYGCCKECGQFSK